jgi:chloramphenicol O-acetyltransferase type A
MNNSRTPIFTPIDQDNWPRKPYFDYYYHQVKCTYSITADLEIDDLLKICKDKSIKLYPALIYIITKVANEMESMRTSHDEQGILGTWDFVSPCYAVFHDDDKTFSNIWTPFNDSFAEFYRGHLDDIDKYGDKREFMPKDNDPGNTFPISCIPWVDFTALNLNIHDDGRYLSPIFTLGKYSEKAGNTVIPLSTQLHHALCDGYHVGVLFQRIREIAASPGDWIFA